MDRCPYCRSEIEVESTAVACTDCGSRYHYECWNSNHGCAVFGCGGRMLSLEDGGLSRVYTAPLLPSVQHIMNLLELSGIQCSITNQYLAAAMGEVPYVDCWPQLWVRDKDLARAKVLLNSLLKENPEPKPAWTCPKCREELEAQFTECWNCGTSRREDERPDNQPDSPGDS